MFEWHGFATVTEPGKKGFSLVVSRVGDWTAKQIDNPPSTLWIWGAPTFGVLCIVPLFCHLVFVATGSGIGPCVPCILEQMSSCWCRQMFAKRLAMDSWIPYWKNHLKLSFTVGLHIPDSPYWKFRYAHPWQARHGQINLSLCQRIWSWSCVHYFKPKTYREGGVWYEESGYPSIWSNLGQTNMKCYTIPQNIHLQAGPLRF